MVVYSPYLMGRSSKLWGPTAGVFDPLRWIDPSTGEPVKEVSPYKMPVFQAGPRICPGKNVALVAATMMLSLILNKVNDRARHFLRREHEQPLGGCSIVHLRAMLLLNVCVCSVHYQHRPAHRRVWHHHRASDRRRVARAAAPPAKGPINR